ncbi:MAG: plasmid mobilization relaxosome protein MobC [Oscillospiraceae bacterium]
MGRKRTIHIDIRVSPTEKDNLLEKATSARLSMTDYILALSNQKRIFIIDGVPQLVVEITRIGTNINQIASVVNAHKTASEYQLQEVQKNLDEVQNKLSQILKQVYSIEDEMEV